MNHKMLLSLGLAGLLSGGCALDEENLTTTESEIKAKRKAFMGQRLANKVSVLDADGDFIGDMTGEGLTTPFGIHAEGDDVYVVSQGNNAVYAHLHGKKEKKHDTEFTLSVLVPSGSGGLTMPFYPTVRNGVLYVSSGGTNEVLKYDADSGALIGVEVEAGAGGLSQPRGVDFDSDGNLYVSSFLTNAVKVYDHHGNYLRDLAPITSPCGISINDDDIICAGSAAGPGVGGVHCWYRDGSIAYTGPAEGPVCGLDWGIDGRLYPTRPNINIVQAHDIETGEIETFAEFPDSPGPSNIAGVSWGTKRKKHHHHHHHHGHDCD